MTTGREQGSRDEAGIEALLREVGARDEPAPEAMLEVRAAVHAEWLSVVRERRRRRLKAAWGMAASLLLATAGGTYALRYMTTADHTPVAAITRIDGSLLAAGDASRPLTPGQSVTVGESIRTDEHSRAALRLGGLSLRMDRGTRLRIAQGDLVVLDSGALYVDSPPAAAHTPLTVRTLAGSVRHLGTQYQVRTQEQSVEVSVREGRVSIDNASGTSKGSAGERIRVTRGGIVTRSEISPQDPEWAWAAETAPPFDIDGQPLAAFLTWVARETGRTLVYASPAAQAAANDVRMRGSIAGLDLETALSTVLATTQLHRYPTPDASLGIELGEDG